jgi:Fic family protein
MSIPTPMIAKPCIPDALPLDQLNLRAIIGPLGEANRALARYDGLLQSLPNPSVLLSPITTNEAVLSSRIEGTQATLDEVLEHDAGVEVPERRRGDIEEVNNYRVAVQLAEAALIDRGLSLSLVRELHQRLMQGVRGLDKSPGAFRDDQNWIGRRGDPIATARFIPPDPTTMGGALLNWEAYVRTVDEDPLLKAATAHAQFEIIHPFKDGNGRIGRMLIPLILCKEGALSRPMFYLSQYLEANREEYYDRLLSITRTGDWQAWIIFFLGAVTAQAEVNLRRAQRILELYKTMHQRFAEATHSQYAANAVEAFFARPVIRAPDFMDAAGFNHRVTANNMLRQLVDADLIQKVRAGRGRQPAIYAMAQLIAIADGRA